MQVIIGLAQREQTGEETMVRVRTACLAAAAAVALAIPPALATNIIDEWASVKAPSPPALKPITVDAKTTALLMLDFMNQNCGKRPRCLATIPAMKKLLADARAKKVAVVYSLIRNTTPADVLKDVAPAADEPSVLSGPNKFLGTELEKILKSKGVTTVIVVGTAAHGAVLNTAAHAALIGLNVIVPVDGMSADPYAEQYTAWHLVNAPVIASKVTLTKSDMIKF